MSEAHILVVDDDELSTRMLNKLLSREGYHVSTHNSPIQALKWLQIPGNRPDLIISDLNMPDMGGHEFIKQVRTFLNLRQLPIIMLTAQDTMSQKVAGFEAGIDDYLVKPVNSTELKLRIKALLARSRAATEIQPRHEATTISVFSLRGGAGTTSVAVNLAIALAGVQDKQVSLVDLALKNGHCALMLNIKPKFTIAHLAERAETQIDADVMEKLLLPHGTGVRLLPAPNSPIEAELVTSDIVNRAWPYLQTTSGFIVIDGGSALKETTLTALDRSHTILLILTPELASLKAAVDALKVFRQLEYEPGRVLPVVNQAFSQGSLRQKDIESALGHAVAATIPFDQGIFNKAINSGKPVTDSSPNSPLGKLFFKLASDLLESLSQTESAAPKAAVASR